MALNSSGPISLGGSTVGQSINLELGQSATALASINATNFRALAGVPSGQISLSNFYGKSNASFYFAVVYDPTGDFGTGTVFGQTGITCINFDGTYLYSGGPNYIPSGSRQSFFKLNASDMTLSTIYAWSSLYSSFASVSFIGSNIYPTINSTPRLTSLTNTLSTVNWAQNMDFDIGSPYSNDCLTTDGTYIYTNSRKTVGGDTITAKWTSTGSLIWAYYTSVNAGAQQNYSISYGASKIVTTFRAGTGTDWRIFYTNTSGSIIGQYVLNGFTGNLTASAIDSSGNVYVLSFEGPTSYLTKLSTSGAVIWTSATSLNGTVTAGIYVDSSDNVYTLIARYGGGASFENIYYLIKRNSSGTTLWQRSFTNNNPSEPMEININNNLCGAPSGVAFTTGGGDTLRNARNIYTYPADGSITGSYSVAGRNLYIAASSLTIASSSAITCTSSAVSTTSVGFAGSSVSPSVTAVSGSAYSKTKL